MDAGIGPEKLEYQDHWGALETPLPKLRGTHQADNAALAIAMLRHQSAITVPPAARRQPYVL